MEKVILVDNDDNEIGTMEKMEAHRKGALHRAFSVLVFNSKGEMLIQKRAKTKYHSGGLWSNACCSHPRPGEDTAVAAKRRMKEELGIDVQPEFLYKFKYKVQLEGDLTEHELDHVYECIYDGEPISNPDEIDDHQFLSLEELTHNIQDTPQRYSYWFNLILKHYNNEIKKGVE